MWNKNFVLVDPKSSATEAAVFVTDGSLSIEDGEDKHNDTKRTSPAVESTSEKLDVAQNSKKIDSGEDISVEVTTDPGSWIEILLQETRMFLIEVGQFSFIISCFRKMNSAEVSLRRSIINLITGEKYTETGLFIRN
jgi:hypothetical protein